MTPLAVSCPADLERSARALSRTAFPTRSRGLVEHELATDRRAALRGLFSDGLGPGAVRPRARHPLPGTRLGGQFGRLLLPGRHVGRSRAHRRAVRAIRQPRAGRGPRHRRRFRARAPRGSAAVRLRKIRPRSGRHDGRGHHLSPTLGRARRGQGAGPVARSGRSRWPRRWNIIDDEELARSRLREAGLDPDLAGRPAAGRAGARSWSAFPGICRSTSAAWSSRAGRSCELVPIENAAMPGRTVIEWDKDDLDELGILKVDCLALGMLTAIRKCFDLVERHYGRRTDAGRQSRRRTRRSTT